MTISLSTPEVVGRVIRQQIGCLMEGVEQSAIGEAYRSARSLEAFRKGDGYALWISGRRLSNQLVGRANALA
jgi:hypothetical protein